MTDREMLEFCLEAFTAIPTADTSRSFMKSKDIPWGPLYGGSASYKLAIAMKRQLRAHLGLLEESKI